MTDSNRRSDRPVRRAMAALGLLAAACTVPGAGDAPGPNGGRERGPGPVLAVGGGGTPREVVDEGLRLARERAGGPVDVVVVPHASGREDRGVGSVEMWREAGADGAALLAEDPAAARAQLAGAEIVWLGGGSQTRLLEHLRTAGLLEAVVDAHRRGAVVGGTSAGAAALGQVTIAGAPEPGPYRVGAMVGEAGLGLVPDAVVDQHFAERGREGRLLTAMADGAAALGFGVGESTCALFEGERMRVLGEGTVVVIDARGRRAAEGVGEGLLSARGLVVHVLRPGDTWSPGDAGRAPAPPGR